MASQPAPDAPPPLHRLARWRQRWTRFSIGLVALLLLLLTVAFGLVRWIDTPSGHRFVADRIASAQLGSGIRVRIGSIEGSIFRRARLHDVSLYDPKGQFAHLDTVDLQWYPLAWFVNRVDIDRLHIWSGQVTRLPEPERSGRKRSILPRFDIRIMDLRIGGLELAEPVAGRAQRVEARGRVDVRSGRAVVSLRARTQGGDSIRLALDSRPDENRFDIDAVATAPQGGLIAGLTGLTEPMAFAVSGDGDWAQWRGRAVAVGRSGTIANVAVDAQKGRYLLKGPVARIGPLAALGRGMAALDADLVFADRVISGAASLDLGGALLRAEGGVDLGRSRFDNLLIDATAADLSRLAATLAGRDATLRARISGDFDDAGLDFLATLAELRTGGVTVSGVRLSGEGRLGERGGAWPIVLDVSAVRTGTAELDGRLRNLSARGVARMADGALRLDGTRIAASGLSGTLKGYLLGSGGALDLALSADMNGVELRGFGRVDVGAALRIARPARGLLSVSGTARANVRRLDNGFLRGLGGGLPVLTSRIALGPDGRIDLPGLHLTAPEIEMTGDGSRARDGSMHVTGSGRHTVYGPLSLVLDGRIERPRVELILERPGQGARLSDVHALLEPGDAGYRMTGNGQSALGPFTLDGAVLLPPGGEARIVLDAVRVADVVARGTLVPVTGGLSGTLALTGPADGSLALRVADGVQHVRLDADIGGARFTGPLGIGINRGSVQADFALGGDSFSLEGKLQARGLRYGSLRVGRLDASASLVDGVGTATVTARAQNGRAFDLTARADINSERVAVNLTGSVEREPLRLLGPAIVRRDADGWRLETVRLSLRNGAMRVGAFVGPESTHVDAQLSRIPLSLLDLVDSELGLGGTADGTLDYDLPRGGVPTGSMQLRIRGLTRSGLALSSSPIDIGVNAALDNRRGAMRAVISEGGTIIGRAQALVTPFGPGSLLERLYAAPLQAQISYAGNAETLWRLTNIELLALGGQVNIAAQARGTLADPQISGTVSARDASLQSPVTGLAMNQIVANGTFDGSELVLSGLSGRTGGGGKVDGSARFIFSAERGIGMDINVQAERALVLDRDDVRAVVTGPLRIRSSGGSGVISGDLDVVSSRFVLGRASAVAQVPQIRLIEINRAGEEIEPTRVSEPWRLDIRARAARGLEVEGLGMSSEWAADLQIGGTVTSPAFRGTANLLEGTYDFAGKRFDLREGRLTFTGATPVDPQLDIRAVADVSDLNATISVTGTSLHPIVAMSSIPAMPQDELLSRLLFGTSITNLSAPEAIQLAAAVAALRGGDSGLDPINAIRRATGLSRLRILPADTTTGQKTAIAAGKYIGRLYVELISDGQGYSATSVEFQITRWLSLLSSVSTVGRQNIGARISKDY